MTETDQKRRFPWALRSIQHRTPSLREAVLRVAYLTDREVKTIARPGDGVFLTAIVARWRLQEPAKWRELHALVMGDAAPASE